MASHKDLTLTNIHRPYAWTYADQTAREAATGFVTADVGKLSLQEDTNFLYMLITTAPLWQLVGAPIPVGGDAGQILKKATGDDYDMEWADETGGGGGRTLIETKTPSGVATVAFTSISGSYSKLTVEFAIRSAVAALYTEAFIYFNNDKTNANYRGIMSFAYGALSVGAQGGDSPIFGGMSGASSPSGSFTIGKIEIPFYAETGFNKQYISQSGHRRDASSVQELVNIASGEWENTAAITRIDIDITSGDYASGAILHLYGE